MNLRGQYLGRCLQGHSVKWIHQCSLCFRSEFNIICVMPQFSVCHTQFNPLSVTHTSTPPHVDQGFFSLFQSQAAVVLSCESYCIYPTTKVPNTRGNWGDLTSPLPTCVCHSPACCLKSSLQQFVLQHQHCPSVSFVCWTVRLRLLCNYMCSNAAFHPAPLLPLIQLFRATKSVKGPLPANYRFIFHMLWWGKKKSDDSFNWITE